MVLFFISYSPSLSLSLSWMCKWSILYNISFDIELQITGPCFAWEECLLCSDFSKSMSINFLMPLTLTCLTFIFRNHISTAADGAGWQIILSKLTLGDYLLKPRLQLSRDTRTLCWEDFRKSPSFTITNGNVTFSTETPTFLFPS